MMEAVSTSETSVNFYVTTRRNIPEDNHLHTRRRENLKSHQAEDLPEANAKNHKIGPPRSPCRDLNHGTLDIKVTLPLDVTGPDRTKSEVEEQS
jgi:hypothetical protein